MAVRRSEPQAAEVARLVGQPLRYTRESRGTHADHGVSLERHNRWTDRPVCALRRRSRAPARGPVRPSGHGMFAKQGAQLGVVLGTRQRDAHEILLADQESEARSTSRLAMTFCARYVPARNGVLRFAWSSTRFTTLDHRRTASGTRLHEADSCRPRTPRDGTPRRRTVARVSTTAPAAGVLRRSDARTAACRERSRWLKAAKNNFWRMAKSSASSKLAAVSASYPKTKVRRR